MGASSTVGSNPTPTAKVSIPEILPNQAGSSGRPGLGESWLDSNGQRRALEKQLLESSEITKSFDLRLQWREWKDLTKEEVGKLLGQYGFEMDTPASDLAKVLTGVVFQELAFLYLSGSFAQKNWLLLNPSLTSTIFKEWSRLLVDQKHFEAIPDGIFVEAQNKQSVVRGFTEYAMSPEINLSEKYNQLLNFQKIIKFLFPEGGWSFLQTMRDHRPGSWPKKLVLGELETFSIFYVIPKKKDLPESLKLAGVVEVGAPFTWREIVDLTKTIAKGYFNVDIR